MSDTTTTAPALALEARNPSELDVTGNYRKATVDKAFAAQLKAHAASPDAPLVPLGGPGGELVRCGNHTAVPVLTRPDGSERVAFGFRRVVNCQAAGVPVLVYVAGEDGDDAAVRRARKIDQFTENHWRQQPTMAEDAALIMTLFDDEGMSAAAIGRATGVGKKAAEAYRTVARSELASKAAEKWDFLTLDHLEVLAEFDGDPAGLADLVRAAKDNPRQFDHVAARLRCTRAEREARATFAAELEAQGVAIYGEQSWVPWTLALENLRDSDGNEITPETHATCPGRAATITYEWGWAPGAEAAYRAAHGLADDDDLSDVEFGSDEEAREAGFARAWQVGRHLCTDPDQYGHANIHGKAEETPTREQRTAGDEDAAAARATEERRRVRRRNTEWRAATEVRTSHLKALLARKAPPAGALKLIVEAMARGETQPLMASFGHQTACELLGLTGNGAAADYRELLLAELARASERRAQVIALAMVLGAAEHGVRDVHTWQSAEGRYRPAYGPPASARYLAWLAEHADYGLSDIEAEVAAHVTGRGGPAGETEPDPDEDEQGQDGAAADARQDQAEADQAEATDAD